MKKKIRKDKRKIPKGYYCYDHLELNKKTGKFKIVGWCPYWSNRKNRPEQECGFCAYLNKGDWDINAEAEIIDPHTGNILRGNDIPFPVSLLWDLVKECGINEG